MWPQLGGHLVVRPHLKPLGQDHEPVGAELDGVAHSRGAAAGTERTGGAIESPSCFPTFARWGREVVSCLRASELGTHLRVRFKAFVIFLLTQESVPL